MKGKYYESEYEESVVELLQRAGWEYTYGGELSNRRITEPLLLEDLNFYLHERYGNAGITEDEFRQIIANIQNISGNSDYDSLRKTVNLYREGYDFVPSYPGAVPFKLEYIDFKHPEANFFRVVNQFEMQQGQQTRRPDVMLFINGIPVCIFELKNPADANATIRDAHTQITVRYRRDIPLLMKYCALACISDGSNTRLGATVSGYEYFYAWKKVQNEDSPSMGVGELETLINGVLTKERILEILRDFVYFPDAAPGEDEKEIEIVCRYPQYFAAKKLQAHLLKHLHSVGGDGRGGTYFGATGCGKTYTMLFLARLLAMRSKSHLGNPTILLIVDRVDLENQAEKQFTRSTEYLGSKSVRTIVDRKDLAQELTSNAGGGFYITTVQKFTESTGLLSERDDIICLSDEAHRTQTNIDGNLKLPSQEELRDGKVGRGAFISHGFAEYLHEALPNATYVGFTGTPIDETIRVFGEVVESYTMVQSQQDGITVPIKYDPRLLRLGLNSEQTEKIEAYYRQCEADGAKPEDVDKSKKIMSSMNVLLGDENILEKLADNIITDYERRCDDQPNTLLKAMVTCSERHIAFKLYKIIQKKRPEWCRAVKALNEAALNAETLKKLSPVPFVNVVATTGKDDPKEMFDLLGDDAHRRMLDREFKSEASNFRIAIVVDMWITGFDAPPLTVLYNYKPLQKHTLIQTISRVNRVYKGKEFGYVVDYIGIRAKMQEALKHYGGDCGAGFGEDDIEKAYEVLIHELDILKDMLSPVDFAPFFGDDALARLRFLQGAAEYIFSHSIKGKGKVSFETEFKGHVRRLRSAFSICNPTGVLTGDEVAWCQCFMGICSFMSKISTTKLDVTAMNGAVEKMMKEAIRCGGVEHVMDLDSPEVNIYSEEFLKELDDVKMPCTKFELLVRLLNRAIREYARINKARADHFGELLAKTLEVYNTRVKVEVVNKPAESNEFMYSSLEERIKPFMDELLKLFRELQTDKTEFRKLGISFEEKAFYDILVAIRDREKIEFDNERCIALARKINKLVEDVSIFADWLNNPKMTGKLSSGILTLLFQVGYPHKWSDEIFDRVLKQEENFRKYRGDYRYESIEERDLAAAEPNT